MQIAKLSLPLFTSFTFPLIVRTHSRVGDENMPVIIWILRFFIETIYYEHLNTAMGLIESDIGQVMALNHLTISISINFILS